MRRHKLLTEIYKHAEIINANKTTLVFLIATMTDKALTKFHKEFIKQQPSKENKAKLKQPSKITNGEKRYYEIKNRYETAYLKCNDRVIETSFKDGYVIVPSFVFGVGSSKHTVKAFERMTEVLENRVINPFNELR